MAVARVVWRIPNFNLPASSQTPIVYSIIRQVWAKEFGKQNVQRIDGLPRMNRKWNRLKRLDDKPNIGDELDGVLAYLGMEKPEPIPNLENITPQQINALSPDELAVAIFEYAAIKGKGWEPAGQVLKLAGLNQINWKDTLVAIRRIIDYNRRTPIRFRSRQNDTNQKTSDFLVGVFGKPGTGLKELEACLNSGVDNALAILTGLSPLNVSGTALASTANRSNIQRYLQKLNNEKLKKEIATRIFSYIDSDKKGIHPHEPLLMHVRGRLDDTPALGWPGFVNARFPSETESGNMGEYDLDLAEE
jgi:hypothetical protein